MSLEFSSYSNRSGVTNGDSIILGYVQSTSHLVSVFQRKIRTHLDLLSIPRLWGKKMSKRLGGIKGCKYKTSSWHLNRFPDADNIGSTV